MALVQRWGSRLRPGASVLELGCADGLVTEVLARARFQVTAVDLSPAMVQAAGQRLERVGLDAQLVVADVDEFEPEAPFDAVLGVMGFFHYSSDTARTLRALVGATRTKIIVDANPGETPVAAALSTGERR